MNKANNTAKIPPGITKMVAEQVGYSSDYVRKVYRGHRVKPEISEALNVAIEKYQSLFDSL